MKKYLFLTGKYAGYVMFALFIFLVTVYMAFPFDRLRTVVARQISEGGRYQVTIGGIAPAFPIGVTLDEVVIVSPPEKPGEKESKMEINRATIRFGLFSLFSDSQDVRFDVIAFGGRIKGETQKADETRTIKASFEELSFSDLPGISRAINLPMKGRVSGRGNIKIPRDGYRMMEGKLTLECSNCTIGDGKTLVKPKFGPQRPGVYDPIREEGVTLPRIRMGRFGGDINIEKGRAEFSQFEALSPDGEGILLGSVMLREPILFSTVQAVFKLRFSDEFKKREPRIQGIEASMALGRREDGLYGMCITKRLMNINFQPCKYSAAERGRRGPPAPPGDRGRPSREGRRPPPPGRGHSPPGTGGHVDNY